MKTILSWVPPRSISFSLECCEIKTVEAKGCSLLLRVAGTATVFLTMVKKMMLDVAVLRHGRCSWVYFSGQFAGSRNQVRIARPSAGRSSRSVCERASLARVRKRRGVDTLGDLGEIPLPGAFHWGKWGNLSWAKRKNCKGFSDFETFLKF